MTMTTTGKARAAIPSSTTPWRRACFYLKAGLPAQAADAFDRALLEAPGNPEAHYGNMLAGSLEVFGFVSGVSN